MAAPEQSTTPLEAGCHSTTSTPATMYDLICIGFGPAQVATAIANHETKKPSKILFLERKTSFSWHSGTHTSRTRMDTPFMYDLATTRNPRSAFSYVSYLLAKKRLIEFANSDRLNPLRMEFEEYLLWCAEQFKEQVRYGNEATEVIPDLEGNVVSAWKVVVRDRDGLSSVIRAKSVVAPSLSGDGTVEPQPLASTDFLAGQRIISMDEYTSRRNELRGVNEPRLNIGIVGSAPQTAEILDDLLSCPRLGNITVVTEDESLAPLRILGEQEPPQPRLCSIWERPSSKQEGAIIEASELIQTIYMRAYEKKVGSKGQYGLCVVLGKDATEPCSKSTFIIRDTASRAFQRTELLQSLDTLVLGCRAKGKSLKEVNFKRGLVAEGCHVFLMSAHSDGAQSLAKDIAVMAGHIVNALSSVAEGRRERTVTQARM